MQNLIQHLPDRAPYTARPSQVLVPDLEFVGASGRTPICLAARQNSVAIVQLVRTACHRSHDAATGRPARGRALPELHGRRRPAQHIEVAARACSC